MKNYLLRLFLSLCIVFLSGYSQLYAHGIQGISHPSSGKLLQYLEQARFASPQHTQDLSARASLSQLKKAPFKLRTTLEKEEKEDEPTISSFKKYSGSLYFSPLFWVHTLRFLFRFGKAALPFSGHFAYFPSFRRHLLFQVFRI
ncbi:MAG: hypothetical protein ACO1O1_13665 [Adhaeribacter sp.]